MSNFVYFIGFLVFSCGVLSDGIHGKNKFNDFLAFSGAVAILSSTAVKINKNPKVE